jgi:hypothetical protein
MSRLQESPEQKGKAEGKRLQAQKGGHQKKFKTLHRKGQECGFFCRNDVETVPDDVKKCNFGRFR